MLKKILIVIASLLVLVLAVVAFFVVRQNLASAAADQKWQTTQVEPLKEIGSTRTLEILPLYDEAGDASRFQIGHGVSYLIKTDSATILMDVGNNPDESPTLPLTTNMQALGVNWDQIDAVVISHFHPDHVGGRKAWQAGAVALGSGSFDLSGKPVYAPSQFDFPGVTPTVLPNPTLIYPGVATIGTIDYGEVFPVYIFQAGGTEQGLAINVAGKGIVLITGCGHPTLERMLTRAEAAFGLPIAGVVGGLHYEGQSDAAVQAHIAFLQARKPSFVALSPHDTSPEAIAAFMAAFGQSYHEIQVGVPLIFQQ